VTRVLLLDHARQAYVPQLAASLGDAGVEAVLVGPQPSARAVDALLARRGFAGGVAHVLPTAARLWRGGFDLAHAFTAPDAVAGLAWRRASGRPVVFTCTETLGREAVANARLRLQMLERAVGESDTVLAASDAVAESMLRWLAVEAPVLDASGHVRLYGELAPQRG
jgi:hypothetical protein